MTNNSLAEIAAALAPLKRVVVASHYGPDPDAYGSSCGLALALRSVGVEVICVNQDGIVERLACIPGVRDVVSTWPDGFSETLIACDCGDRGRVGDEMVKGLGRFSTIVNIDHHATNDFFGTLNHVDPRASSTSEMILELLRTMKIKITPEVAYCLFAGIAADTGSFRYSSTSAATFAAAQYLVEHGAKPNVIAQDLFQNHTLGAMKLQAAAIANMQLHASGQVAIVVVTKAMCESLGADPDDAEELKHITQTIAGVRLSAVIREADDLWRISLRAKDTTLDVAAVAEKYGGGGHRAAAAFRWRKPLEQLLPKLQADLHALLV